MPHNPTNTQPLIINARKQVWGTCAGMILLSDKAVMQKDGGQALVGGLDVEVCRNFFGSQVPILV